MYAIYDTERSFDERICRTPQDVHDHINGADLSRSHFIVVEFDTDEGRCRDVTDLFITDETEMPEYAAYDRAASAADRRHQLEREMA